MGAMIRSMTGYGRGEHTAGEWKFTVEIKSVNHKFNDITIKLPRSMNKWEDKIKKCVMQDVFRGKTDVYIGFETFAREDVSVKVNEALAAAYTERIFELKEKFKLKSKDTLGILLRFPDIITVEKVEGDDLELFAALQPALTTALEQFVAMREAEGIALKTDILNKAEIIRGFVDIVKERSPFVVKEYQKKLSARLSELLDGGEIEPARLAGEVALFADKSCIDEEVIRLYSHIEQLAVFLESEGMIGRKLDFLVQEMNREANTICSKANDLEITKAAIELKSEIEKMREQMQNIE